MDVKLRNRLGVFTIELVDEIYTLARRRPSRVVVCEVWRDMFGKELRCTYASSGHSFIIPLGFTSKEITPMGAALLIRAYEHGLMQGTTRGEEKVRKLLREAIGK